LARKPDETGDLFCTPPLPVAKLDDAERLACLRLIRSENVGPATFQALINRYGGAEKALEALPHLARRGGRKRTIRLCPRDSAEREIELAAKADVEIIFTIEPHYPTALAATDHPPPLIYAKGYTDFLNQPAIAIVGSRQCSAAGASLTRQIASDLGRHGYVVASGLARGIDGAAHEAALATGTVAVLAGGIDNVYPPEHHDLQERIARLGCLISEQPLGYKPKGRDFPRRNRIISGISHAVVVVEAARRSGSLSTARQAADQGRHVYAVPGHPLDPRAEGTNSLLKNGALLITSAEDLLSDLRPLFRDQGPPSPRSDPAKPGFAEPRPPGPPPLPPGDAHRVAVLAALGPAPVTVDDLARATNIPVGTLQTVLLDLTLAGYVDHHGQQLVSLRVGATADTE
jgi:DNA processing protein